MQNKRIAVLAVSFGTTVQETLELNISAVEEAVAQAVPGCVVFRAFTSSMIRKILAKKGVQVDSVEEAIARIREQGFRHLVAVPTHILAGSEYSKAVHAVRRLCSGGFESVAVAKPLLYDAQDHCAVLAAVAQEAGAREGEALVLMGHGTSHPIDVAYAALNFEAGQMGLSHVFVGTVEGSPDVQATIRRVKEAGYSRVCLAPLMLVAGNHAQNDMAGDGEESWKSLFQSAGITVRCLVRGLGESPAVRSLYAKHAAEAACEVEDAL